MERSLPDRPRLSGPIGSQKSRGIRLTRVASHEPQGRQDGSHGRGHANHEVGFDKRRANEVKQLPMGRRLLTAAVAGVRRAGGSSAIVVSVQGS
jgi:hypothetical protein